MDLKDIKNEVLEDIADEVALDLRSNPVPEVILAGFNFQGLIRTRQLLLDRMDGSSVPVVIAGDEPEEGPYAVNVGFMYRRMEQKRNYRGAWNHGGSLC